MVVVVRTICPDCTGVVGFNYFPECREETATVEEREDIRCFCGDAIAPATFDLLVDAAYTLGFAEYASILSDEDEYGIDERDDEPFYGWNESEPDDSDVYGYGFDREPCDDSF